MNDNFVKAINERGYSLYEFSKDTKIPYTTINQLYNGKRNINKVAAETVLRIAAALEKPLEYVINPVSYVENYPGFGDAMVAEEGGSYVLNYDIEGVTGKEVICPICPANTNLLGDLSLLRYEEVKHRIIDMKMEKLGWTITSST